MEIALPEAAGVLQPVVDAGVAYASNYLRNYAIEKTKRILKRKYDNLGDEDTEGRIERKMAYAKRRKMAYSKGIKTVLPYNKTKKTWRKKKYIKKVNTRIETFTATCAGVPITRIANNDAQVNFVCKADVKNLYNSANTAVLQCYKAMYEEFRISKISFHFRLTTASTVADPTEDNIITMYNAYDCNAFGKKFSSINEITKVPGYRRRVMKPFQDYSCVLYPKWSNELVVGAGSNKVNIETKSGVWMNTINIDTANVFSTNGQQVGFNGFNKPLPATKKTIVELQEYVTYQFRKRTNNATYAP